MKQVDIVDGTDWSKSKVSMLLSDMEDDGESRARVGRENIISLAGQEPDAAGHRSTTSDTGGCTPVSRFAPQIRNSCDTTPPRPYRNGMVLFIRAIRTDALWWCSPANHITLSR